MCATGGFLFTTVKTVSGSVGKYGGRIKEKTYKVYTHRYSTWRYVAALALARELAAMLDGLFMYWIHKPLYLASEGIRVVWTGCWVRCVCLASTRAVRSMRMVW